MMNSNYSTIVCSSLLCLLIGCVQGCVQGRESLHEMDHTQPAHWPVDLRDAKEKLQARESIGRSTDSTPEARQQARQELLDIVRWMPEIAADTDMPESTWNKIYERSESIRKALQSNRSAGEVGPDIESLCQLLEQSITDLAAMQSRQNSEGQ
jgi:hypothetical protein